MISLLLFDNINYSNYKKKHLVQINSNLIIDSVEISSKVKNVESKLYGELYGKSSK